PGRAPVAGGADSLVDERLRQAPPIHRPQEDHRRVLPQTRRRADRDPPLDQPSPHDPPVADPAHHPPTPLTIIRRALLSQGWLKNVPTASELPVERHRR